MMSINLFLLYADIIMREVKDLDKIKKQGKSK